MGMLSRMSGLDGEAGRSKVVSVHRMGTEMAFSQLHTADTQVHMGTTIGFEYVEV